MKWSGFIAASGLGISIITSVLIFSLPVAAAGILPTPTGKCPEEYAKAGAKAGKGGCQDGHSRDYSLEDIKSLMGNVGNLMLGVSGAIALFVFVLGGFFFLASAGSSGMVEKGKGMMMSGVIGLAIVFFAFTLISYGVRILTGSEADNYIPKPADPGSVASADAAPVYSVAKFASGFTKSQLCVAAIGGKCQPKGKCASGTPITGACSGSQDCCVQVTSAESASECGKLGGICQQKSKDCYGAFIKNLCLDGGDAASSAIQCCLDSSK